MKKRNYLFFVAAVLIAIVTMAFNTPAMAQKVNGAIFTTDRNSSYVDGNVYDFGEDVYLNGGPRPNAPCTAAGLPDGDYYFQVTDPSGSMVLSSDAITERGVTVAGGLIVSHWRIGLSGHEMGSHDIWMGKCSGTNITVQLAPFALTPNPGGEYKAWMTKVSDYNTYGGFAPSKSKTDNFKVIPPLSDSTDSDNDGIPDSQDNCPDYYDITNLCELPPPF